MNKCYLSILISDYLILFKILINLILILISLQRINAQLYYDKLQSRIAMSTIVCATMKIVTRKKKNENEKKNITRVIPFYIYK